LHTVKTIAQKTSDLIRNTHTRIVRYRVSIVVFFATTWLEIPDYINTNFIHLLRATLTPIPLYIYIARVAYAIQAGNTLLGAVVCVGVGAVVCEGVGAVVCVGVGYGQISLFNGHEFPSRR